jgi:hypothetical protein
MGKRDTHAYPCGCVRAGSLWSYCREHGPDNLPGKGTRAKPTEPARPRAPRGKGAQRFGRFIWTEKKGLVPHERAAGTDPPEREAEG